MARIQYEKPNKTRNMILINTISIAMLQRDIARKYGFKASFTSYHDDIVNYSPHIQKAQKTERDIADIVIEFNVLPGRHMNWDDISRVKSKMPFRREFNIYFRKIKGKLYVHCLSNYLKNNKYIVADLVFNENVVEKIVDKIEKYLEQEIKESDERMISINTPKEFRMFQEITDKGKAIENRILLYDGLLTYWFKNIKEVKTFLKNENGILKIGKISDDGI